MLHSFSWKQNKHRDCRDICERSVLMKILRDGEVVELTEEEEALFNVEIPEEVKLQEG